MIPAFLHKTHWWNPLWGLGVGVFCLFLFLHFGGGEGKKSLRNHMLKCLQILNTSPVLTVSRHPAASAKCSIAHWIFREVNLEKR